MGTSLGAFPSSSAAGVKLLNGQYEIMTAVPLPGAGGGLPAFAARHQPSGRADLMAVRASPGAPPRANALARLEGEVIPGLLIPLAHGSGPAPEGGETYYVICPEPPGPSLAALTANSSPWSEAEILQYVLRPAAHVLEALKSRGLTHRAIRPDNIFSAGTKNPVVLGCAWAAPPASLQPAVFEPPYTAMCAPAGRGDGSIADDVYALGVTLLTLALGRTPLAERDAETVILTKLSHGGFEALTADAELPPLLADLLRSMLAEDPAHRPSPGLLLDITTARSRRVTTRPPRRAQRPLALNGASAWDARSLAYQIATHPEQGARLLRNGAVTDWIRRELGANQVASTLEELVRWRAREGGPEDRRADSILVLRAVAVLDPLAPPSWRGISLWPDGVGPALAAAMAKGNEELTELRDFIISHAIALWAAQQGNRVDGGTLRQQAQQMELWLRARDGETGLARLTYALNPLLPCASPLLAGRWVVSPAEVLKALEAAAAQPELRRLAPMDTHLAAFIAVRQELQFYLDVWEAARAGPPARLVLAELNLLVALEARHNLGPLPQLSAWVAERAKAALELWHSRSRRAALEQQLQALATGGRLQPILALLDDPTALQADAEGLQNALARIGEIDAELAQIAAGSTERAALAERIGREFAAGATLAALTATLVAAALG